MPTATDELRGASTARRREREHRARAFAPPPGLTVSQWADTHRILSATSPEPGRWRTARAPYLREILDACADPELERVVCMKSAQVGWTEALLNVIGYTIDQDPGPTLLLQPTGDAVKMFSKERLTPMLRDTPRLRGKVKASGRRDSENTLQTKIFPGGYLAMVGSNSAVGLRSRPIRRVLADEVDGYGVSAKSASKEGDPLSLAIKRTQNFWNRKICEGSTPTVKGASRIEADFALTDQRHYHVPCPHCGYYQPLRWGQLRYDKANLDDVWYVCGDISADGELVAGCGERITEDRKGWMLERGRWVPTHPGRRWAGFHVWAAYSPWASWSQLAREWQDAQGNPELLRVFVNTVLGESWEERQEQIAEASLVARREQYGSEVPAGVGVLTMGVDVQGDRLELDVWGFGVAEESWHIEHQTVWGDPARLDDVWAKLDLQLRRTWTREDGLAMKLSSVAVDSGGHHTDTVYRYCKARQGAHVWAVKGSSEPGHAPVSKPSKGNRIGALLFSLGTEAIKDTLFARLRVAAQGPGYVHLPWSVDEEWIQQLTAEVVRVHYKNKRPVRRYEKLPGRRNEALDCAVYAYAAFIISGLRERMGELVALLEKRAEKPAAPMPLQPIRPPRPPRLPRRGGFVNGWRS